MTTSGALTLAADGSATWQAIAAAPAFAATVDVGGLTLTADVTDPSRLLGWSIAHPDDLVHLDRIFGGEAWWPRARMRVETGLPGLVDGPELLAANWARVLLVSGCRRWYPFGLDPMNLVIDEGLAWFDAGEHAIARGCFEFASDRLWRLAEDALDDRLSPAVAALVARATTAAANLLSPGGPAPFDELSVRLTTSAALAKAQPDQWDLALRAWTQADSLVLVESAEAGPAGGGGQIDPNSVPLLRALEHIHPRQHDIELHSDPSTGLLRVTINLAERTSAGDREARSMIAIAARADTGRPWSSAPMSPDENGRSLIADLPLYDADSNLLVVGVYHAESGDRPRLDQFGRTLTLATRLLLDAWAQTRWLEAQLAAGVDPEPLAPDRNPIAEAKQAEELSERLRRTADAVANADETPNALRSTAERDADRARRVGNVAGHYCDVAEGRHTRGAASGPLLAEIPFDDE